MLSVYTGG